MNWRSIIAVLCIGLLLVVQIVYWVHPVSVHDIALARDELLHVVDQYPILSAAGYILFYVLSILFGIPISATMIGGHLFGTIRGAIYSMIAIIIGTTILCYTVRFLYRDWTVERYKKKLEPFKRAVDEYGLIYIMIIHAIPFMPSFMPHVAAAISDMKLYKIILASSLAAIPLTIAYSIAGDYLRTVGPFKDFMVDAFIFILFIGLLFLAAMIYRSYRKKSIRS